MSEWINVEDSRPKHMQIVNVFIDNPIYQALREQYPDRDPYPFNAPHERSRPAVYLGFTGSFYDAEEQQYLPHVTKWRVIDE